MQYERLDIPLARPVCSLCWYDDVFIDWAGGCRVIRLDGSDTSNMSWAFRFDAAIRSPTGRFSVIYERLGTKAAVLDRGRCIRQLNRDFECANVYEYPVVLFQRSDGVEAIAHCPEAYDRIEIEDAETGRRLTAPIAREPADIFHSRLAMSPDSRRLLSAGWIWHPWNTASCWLVEDAIANPAILDALTPPDTTMKAEIDDVVFLDADRLIIATNPVTDSGKPGSLSVYDLRTNTVQQSVPIHEPLGHMMPLAENKVVAFYKFPKVVDLTTGQIEMAWPDIPTDDRTGSIMVEPERLAPIALDPARRRFAVAAPDHISIVSLPE